MVRLHLSDEYALPLLAHCTRKSKTAGAELAPASQSKEPGALTRFPHRTSPRANKNAFRFSLPEKRKAYDQTPYNITLVYDTNFGLANPFAGRFPLKRMLADEHGIAERQHAIALLDGMLIRIHDVLAGAERANQHHERAARHVEVRDQGVHHVERAARQQI